MAKVLTILMCSLNCLAFGQAAVMDSDKFQKELQRLIKDYFESYNACNAENIAALLSDDFEFYHDLAGPVTGKDRMKKIIEDVCKRHNFDWVKARPIGEQKIFQLKQNDDLYGAIVTGELLFYSIDKQNGREIQESTSSFTWVLKRNESRWLIARDLSYNHKDLTK